MRMIGGFLLLFAASSGWGQTPDGQPAFEVASIKPAAPQDGHMIRMGMKGGPGTPDPGRFTAENLDLISLIAQAYDVKRFQVSGASWMASTRFDINAKVPAAATKEQFRLMLQNLLAERFKMTLHREKKEAPIYELVVAKGGPKLKESAPPSDEASAREPEPPGPPKLDKEGIPVFPAGRQGAMIGFAPGGRARLQAMGQTMDQFINMLSNQVDRPVIDETGLKGKYDFSLSFAMEMGMGRGMMGLPPPPPGDGGPAATAPDGEAGPTLFTALQEQLGLRLEAKRGPVDILVIDRMEKTPTEN
jgi:uncharacterized protein (TIGR03435 family)